MLLLSLLLISSLPFTLLIKPLLPSWVHEIRLLLILLLQELLLHFLLWLRNSAKLSIQLLTASPKMSNKVKCASSRMEQMAEESTEESILDLPELALECILEKLTPAALAAMCCVSTSLRDRCRDDHFWQRHMRDKWSGVLGHAAKKEWELCMADRKGSSGLRGVGRSIKKSSNWMESLSCVWPLSWIKSKFDTCDSPPEVGLRVDSAMSWYLALESGKFWFPAQVYNREDGHVGFVLSCYDAHLSYDQHTDTFCARYPPHGRKPVKVEEAVHWSRIRAPPVNTPVHDLHVSDCLNDLRPGDHFEIQWRKSKEFPYGWWYGIVGHLESCNASEHSCRCHENDTVILEFKHYAPGSRWRQTSISRKDHQEKGDETVGFYGGIRKLQTKEEISMWKKFWPIDVLD